MQRPESPVECAWARVHHGWHGPCSGADSLISASPPVGSQCIGRLARHESAVHSLGVHVSRSGRPAGPHRGRSPHRSAVHWARRWPRRLSSRQCTPGTATPPGRADCRGARRRPAPTVPTSQPSAPSPSHQRVRTSTAVAVGSPVTATVGTSPSITATSGPGTRACWARCSTHSGRPRSPASAGGSREARSTAVSD